MGKYMKADEVIVLFEEYHYSLATRVSEFGEALRKMPTVDAEPVKRGKWINVRHHNDPFCNRAWQLEYCCPFCGHIENEFYVHNGEVQYCSKCGAKLEVDENEDGFIERWWDEDE